MKTSHAWDVRHIGNFPAKDEYDIDITLDLYGKLCTCRACGLRVVASETRMPGDVPDHALPACRPLS